MRLTDTIWQRLTELPTTHEQQHEFIKKYKNTVVGIRHKNNNFFCVFKKCIDNTYLFIDLYKNPIILKNETKTHLYTPKITKGYYTTSSGTIFYLRKTGYRQWMRGLTADNTHAESIDKIGSYPSNYETLLMDLMTNKDKPFLEINTSTISKLQKNPYYYLLSRDFIVGPSVHHPEGYDVMFHKHTVGHITETPNGLTLKITTQHFIQEILDSIGTWGPTLSIVYK